MAGKRATASVPPPAAPEDRLGAVEEQLDLGQHELSQNLADVKGELQATLQQQWASIMERLDRLTIRPGPGESAG